MTAELYSRIEFKGIKLGLEAIGAVHQKLGEPAFSYDVVHVAGTNGKGSVSTKIAAGLQESGKKVGLFTSPHVESVNERIAINGQPIEDIDVLLKEVLPYNLSFFETLTMAAFITFERKQVDIAVIEVGLGGRLDATNIVKPILSVITSIDYDHASTLGNTLEKIAGEKAGIIKPGVPVVLGPHAKPTHVFEAKGERILQVDGIFESYELENQAIARKALNYLGVSPSQQALEKRPRCRFEKRGNVILDVAHNLGGLKALFKRLPKNVTTIAGFSADKEINEMIAYLKSQTNRLHLTQADHDRAHNFYAPSVSETIQQLYDPDEVLVICGSVYIMGEALKTLASLENGEKVSETSNSGVEHL